MHARTYHATKVPIRHLWTSCFSVSFVRNYDQMRTGRSGDGSGILCMHLPLFCIPYKAFPTTIRSMPLSKRAERSHDHGVLPQHDLATLVLIYVSVPPSLKHILAFFTDSWIASHRSHYIRSMHRKRVLGRTMRFPSMDRTSIELPSPFNGKESVSPVGSHLVHYHIGSMHFRNV
jgi:hypothetical protein